MGAIIFIVIFFGIIAVLVVVAFIGSKKDKQEKLIDNDKKRKISSNAEKSRIIIFISLNKMIQELEKEIKNFVPSVGIKSLGDINKDYSTRIKNIQSSKELEEVFEDPNYKLEMKDAIKKLSEVKPSLWWKNSDIQFSFNVINAKTNVIVDNKKNEKYVKEGNNKKWN